MLAAAVSAAADGYPSDPAAQLAEAGWAYMQFALAHPAHLRVMFGGQISTPTTHPGLRSAGETAFNRLVGIVRAGQQAGVIVDGTPEQLALTAWALVHGLAVLAIEHQIPESSSRAASSEQLTRMCGALLYKGLRCSLPPTR